jgi:drug/metabolite transporter superfamily protein YnfA
MYLIVITIGLCLSYFILAEVFYLFFEKQIGLKREVKRASFSLALIIVLSLAIYSLVFSIENVEVGNRILHGFGGGFMAFLVCFLVVRDNKMPMTKTQFFILSSLFVTALGVTNEIVEFVFQNYFGQTLMAATTINDTWLDLVSNTAGLLIASVCFVPFVNRPKK